MEVIFLGTNGWYDTATGNTISILLQFSGQNVVFDAGNGFYKTGDYVEDNGSLFLFLSHFHLDHISGLHMLNKMKNLSSLTICGPSGIRKTLRTFINRPFTVPFNKLPFPVSFHELPGKKGLVPFKLTSRYLRHTVPTLGYRIETDEGVVSYCPDTGYCRNAVMLAKNSDLLIAECAYKSGQENPKWPHLNPESAARIAKEAGVKRLALVHFDASLYRTSADRKKAGREARRTFRNTLAAEDNMRIKV